MRILKLILACIGILILALLLTLLTQVGGLLLLLLLPFLLRMGKSMEKRWQRRALRVSTFVGIYVLTTLLIIPPLAQGISGRVPLPLWTQKHVAPLTWIYPLSNRHYVKPELKALLQGAATHMQRAYPGTVLAYLDGNFPFIDEFPLLPHRSHDDGEKVDICFLYQEGETEKPINGKALTHLGYGSIEGPRPKEWDQISYCLAKGYWQYDLLSRITFPRTDWVFDQDRNRVLVRWLARQPQTGKIFIEPHLKVRMGLQGYNKIRFHGCPAVRHDDHIHLQL